LQGGVLSGTGTLVHTNVSSSLNTITNLGTILRPGLPYGVLTFGNRFVQEAGGVLEIELAGLTPGTQHDQLAVEEVATLGGTLRLQLRNGFMPAVGDEFAAMTYRTRRGGSTFAVVEGQDIGGGKRLEVVYESTRVLIRCVQSP